MLSDASDGMEALSFEINQSLYMFSQKAKSDLDRIYLICEAPDCRDKLSQALGREVKNLPPLKDQCPDAVKIPEMEPLDGLLAVRERLHGVPALLQRRFQSITGR